MKLADDLEVFLHEFGPAGEQRHAALFLAGGGKISGPQHGAVRGGDGVGLRAFGRRVIGKADEIHVAN